MHPASPAPWARPVPGRSPSTPARARSPAITPGAWIDTGAFGKGAALRSAARKLSERGVRSALLDLGGQVLALGRDASTGSPWSVGRGASRRSRQEAVARLLVEDVSVATSGNSERAGTVRGDPVGHLFDARTGWPTSVWGSVTVVAANDLVADVLSTALYVMGPADGLAWSQGLPDVGALFLCERAGALVGCCNAAMGRWLVDSAVPLVPGPTPGSTCS